MPNCKCCGKRVVNGVVLHSECYEELSKRADELGEELTAAMELVRERNKKIELLVAEGKKAGEWVKCHDDTVWWWECSCCRERPLQSRGVDILSAYCHNCGAKMEVARDAWLEVTADA